MKVFKVGMKCIFIFLCVMIALDFVPIKFAKNKNLIQNQSNAYVCHYTQTTYGNYVAPIEDNPKHNKQYYFEITEYPISILKNEAYRKEYEEPTGVQYVFYGPITVLDENNSAVDCSIEIQDWAMVYPIMRPSYRAVYAPKGYLTVYDFDWGEIIRRMFD